MAFFTFPWRWKRKENKVGGHLDYYERAKTFKKVFCGDCEYFKKEPNPNYYMHGNGGQSTEEFIYTCLHPKNVKRVDRYYDTFEGKRPIYQYPSRPQSLNMNNRCPWHTQKRKEEPSWEK